MFPGASKRRVPADIERRSTMTSCATPQRSMSPGVPHEEARRQGHEALPPQQSVQESRPVLQRPSALQSPCDRHLTV